MAGLQSNESGTVSTKIWSAGPTPVCTPAPEEGEKELMERPGRDVVVVRELEGGDEKVEK